MTRFGDFAPLCKDVPSYPWCNLFYRQLQKHAPATLASAGPSADTSTAPVGINPRCAIPNVAAHGSLGNIANVVACALSIIVVLGLIYIANRRKAAVGRVEIRAFFVLYLLTLPLQLITTGSYLHQGSTALVVITAIHAGAVAALFWVLLANAIVATQVVEDGTLSSLVPVYFFTVAFFAATTYISLDVALSITSTFGPSNPPEALHSIPLFVLTSIWPAAAAVLYLVLMGYVVLGILRELRPMAFYVLSGGLFVLAQLAWFLLGRVICDGSNHKVDGSFVATVLETLAVGVLYLGWRNITEESWDEDIYYRR